MDVHKGQFVRIECELKVVGGEIIESSKKSGSVEYKHGSGQMLTALEGQLEGMKVGEEKSGVIKAADAFGSAATQVERKIPRKEFPEDTKFEKGSRFEAKATNGPPVVLEITEVTDEAITTKVIHPLADKDIDFKVKVLAIRPPPPPVPMSSPPPEDLLVPDEE